MLAVSAQIELSLEVVECVSCAGEGAVYGWFRAFLVLVHPQGGPSVCAQSRLEFDVDSKFLPYVQGDKKAFRHPLPQQVTTKMAAFWPGCILARLGAETDKPRPRASPNAHCPALFDTLAERGDLT